MTTQTTPNNADLFLDWLNFQKNERLPKLKSANATIIANVIKGWEKEYTRLAYDDENNAMFWQDIALFSFALRVVAVGKIPARLKSGEIMRFATGKQD